MVTLVSIKYGRPGAPNGGPVVKTLPSNAEGVGSVVCQGAKMSHASQPKDQNINRSNIVTNSIKDFKKMVHIKKNH